MSKLSLGESIGDSGSSSLSLKLDGSSRQSAFHANPASSGNSNMDSSGNPIHAANVAKRNGSNCYPIRAGNWIQLNTEGAVQVAFGSAAVAGLCVTRRETGF
ncbi:hypothetical protein Gorai_015148 [Gossypium raimondii]|uniref:Uncharacterized protein n=1 Tax=Gossypium raimondii TaxID=29730 RepID=A0A7J8P503_GOSRA|nr:hypothetical protein [Gossypium raimondii]